VVGLLAVAPDGVGVLNGDVIGWESRGSSGNGHESRIESTSFRAARGLESALGDSVVLDLELEDDGVANGGSD